MSRLNGFGFGFCPDEAQHHFRVMVGQQAVTITEHFVWPARTVTTHDGELKISLPIAKWAAIADESRAEFNRRLKASGLRTSRWTTRGETLLTRLLGKELVLLAWAIEDADPVTIPTAIRNWLGLQPEERWWLYSMTNAATGHAVNGRGQGWRKAVRFALTENPVSTPRLNS